MAIKRLRQLKAAVEGIVPGMQEAREALQAVGRGEREHGEGQRRRGHQQKHVAHARARHEQHRETGREQHRRRAEVGLEQQQQRAHREQTHRLQQSGERVHQLLALAHAVAAHPGENQHLGELRDLKIDRPDAHPAARAVDGRAEARNEHQQQQQQPEQQQRQAILVPELQPARG